MNLFQQAWRQLPLSPAERAALKLLWGIIWTALIAGASAGVQYLASNEQSVNWVLVWTLASGAFTTSILETLRKYFTAQGDIPPPTSSVPLPPITQPVPITPTMPNSALMTNIRPLGPSHTTTCTSSGTPSRGLLSSFTGTLTQRKVQEPPPQWIN